ncbi:RNA-binding transcriptional accessory protein [bacterium]|nr:RNA-binding transcriptional accessory protein [bacterium]
MDYFIKIISKELSIKEQYVNRVVELLNEDNTVPFIARYRKEQTGNMDEIAIRDIQDRYEYLSQLKKRKETVLNTIEEQGKLTTELKSKIDNCWNLQELEDIYLPYKPKRKTKGSMGIEKGLEPLADLIFEQKTSKSLNELAKNYISPTNELHNESDVLLWCSYIIAEKISQNSDIINLVRDFVQKSGLIQSKIGKNSVDDGEIYKLYYSFESQISNIVPHRTLAINRGETEGILSVSIVVNEDRVIELIQSKIVKTRNSEHITYLKNTLIDSFKRLIFPSVEREFRNRLTEDAESHAISVFATNLKNLLLQPPVANRTILGIDPGFRTGCKIAVINPQGEFLDGGVIYPTEPQKDILGSEKMVSNFTQKWGVNLIAIGNGTASRETEEFIANWNEKREIKIPYMIVSEAGASVYSASDIAREEFPDFDATMRGNISIARRVLDPLAELIKIDPKSIGVGLYQHDVNQKKLEKKLGDVVVDCVHYVGVNLNTASYSLLEYVSGINKKSAKNLIEYRLKNGVFKSRDELKKVKGVGDKAFEQAAGFLRINNGKEALDQTGIHPESYDIAKKLLITLNINNDWNSEVGKKTLENALKKVSDYSEKLNVGVWTLQDIINELLKPGRDPRDSFDKPILKKGILKIEDVSEGMILKGTVRNVVDFGAFIDVGLKNDGLVHISELSNKFVKNPHEIVEIGAVVDVKVISIDLKKQRLSLSMKI